MGKQNQKIIGSAQGYALPSVLLLVTILSLTGVSILPTPTGISWRRLHLGPSRHRCYNISILPVIG
jgi:hypothetical protein